MNVHVKTIFNSSVVKNGLYKIKECISASLILGEIQGRRQMLGSANM